MKKRKLRKNVKSFLIKLALAIILTTIIIIFINKLMYHKTYEYKFLNLNYSKEEIKVLTDKLSNENLDELLTYEYNKFIPELVKEKYFMFKNLKRYIDYKGNNLKLNNSEIIARVNVSRDSDYYENTTPARTDLKEKMLVNKYNVLDETYAPDNLEKVSLSYAYANQKIIKEVYDAYTSLADDAKQAGYTILILSSFRDYNYQEKLWKDYRSSYGTTKADQYAARAGASEHETGYAIDVADYYHPKEFASTDAFLWIKDNAHKYGFILRYPEGKEEITGYAYEAWHYRYVGKELATTIYNEGITFDEYYEFYLNN